MSNHRKIWLDKQIYTIFNAISRGNNNRAGLIIQLSRILRDHFDGLVFLDKKDIHFMISEDQDRIEILKGRLWSKNEDGYTFHFEQHLGNISFSYTCYLLELIKGDTIIYSRSLANFDELCEEIAERLAGQ